MSGDQPDPRMMEPWPDRALAVNANVLIIAVRPSEETSRHGGLIAELCRRGRPPFVTILTDGGGGEGAAANAVAAARAAATRSAVVHLGLPPERLLLIGLHDGASEGGPGILDALVAAYDLLSWARDCQVVCVPGDPAGSPDHALTRDLGLRLSRQVGLGCVLGFSADAAVGPEGAVAGRLPITRHLAAKRRALAEYSGLPGCHGLEPAPYENLAVLGASAEKARFWI